MDKLKILIADDEPKIIQLIIELIDWDKLDVELLDTVSTGYDAYEYAKNLCPDILISDIRMPVYDGIEVLKKLHEDNIRIPTLIISGYKQFDYAIKALKYGAQDFLIKPINGQELNAALEKICTASRNTPTPHVAPTEIITPEKNYEWFRAQLILDCLNQNIMSDDIANINQVYGTKFQPGYYQVVAVRIDTNSPMHYPFENDEFNEIFNVDKFFIAKVHNIFDSFTESNIFIDKESMLVSNIFYGILNIDIEQLDKCHHILEDMHRELDKEFSKYANITPIMSISTPCQHVEELPNCFSQITSLFSSKSMLDHGKSLYFSECNIGEDPFSFVSSELLKELDQYILAHNSTRIQTEIQSLLNNCKTVLVKSPLQMNHFIQQLINLIRFCANKMELSLTEPELMQLETIYYTRTNYQEIELFTNEVFQHLTQVLQQNLLKESVPVQLVKKYISQNFAQKISLETLTEVTGLSNTYLSSIFKSETGETITDFITTCRITKAQELLLNTTMNVSEIADTVGYIDSRYFSKIFIKQTGLRPMQYRKYNLT